ncbi:MAG TPA: type II/IV secretion system protein [Deltaproteobacteria bacterium]|nr:type II/IV secretion system protein [Deltaproteobacteria bacterium]
MAKKSLTLEFVAELLEARGLMDGAQRKEVAIRGETQRARLQKAQESQYSGLNLQTIHQRVSPAEVIASFEFEIPGGGGRILTEDRITEAIADEVGLPYKKIDPLKLDFDLVTSRIPRPFAQKHLIVPVDERDGAVILAVADPFELEAVDNLTRTTRMKASLVLSSKSDILKIVREFYGFRTSVAAAQRHRSLTPELGNLEQYVKLKGSTEIEATDQHIVSAVEYLLRYAYDQRASDIHIEPKRNKSVVRLRIDGVLHTIHTIPKPVHPSIVSRIKMLSRMDIAEKRRPQDGRIKTDYMDREIELRVSTLPTAFGEKVVIRIFDPDILFQDLGGLGFDGQELRLFRSFLQKKHGIILVTGPTGSGKTTTLYSALKELATPEVNVVTIEDPIEMVVEDFNQIGVQPSLGVDFASSIRTILRQDPDIIMVGEIRDGETASNAVQAALTGHLVLSTLHTNDAPSAVTRLLDLGVQSFLISSTVLGVMAQRLVRRICPHCKTERPLAAEERRHLGITDEAAAVSYGRGCTECRGTGYKGRTGVFEIMEFTGKMRSVITDDVPLDRVREVARQDGMRTLRENAIKKMLQGVTTYEEVATVTG